MNKTSKKSVNENLIQLQTHAYSPYSPDVDKWFKHYMAEASGPHFKMQQDLTRPYDNSKMMQQDPTRPYDDSKMSRPIVVSPIKDWIDQARSELSLKEEEDANKWFKYYMAEASGFEMQQDPTRPYDNSKMRPIAVSPIQNGIDQAWSELKEEENLNPPSSHRSNPVKRKSTSKTIRHAKKKKRAEPKDIFSY